jgi:hypothetical protein
MPAALYFEYCSGLRRRIGTETRQREGLPCSNAHDRATAACCHVRQDDVHCEPAVDDAAGRSLELRQRRVPVPEQFLSAAGTSSDKGVSG